MTKEARVHARNVASEVRGNFKKGIGQSPNLINDQGSRSPGLEDWFIVYGKSRKMKVRYRILNMHYPFSWQKIKTHR